MDRGELKKIVHGYLEEGLSLGEIQGRLASEHDETMTFLDLRLLAAELEGVDWTRGEAPEPEKDERTDEGKLDAGGGTVVEISKIAKPGVALSGSVKFASGASAEWSLDSYGRLAFDKQTGTPTQQDIMEFQEEMRNKLGGAK